MMFVLRAFLVALGFFGVVYCLLSLLVAGLWRCAAPFFKNSAMARVRLLFAIRIFPLAGSVFLTLAFAVPAFALLEGGKIDEDSGTILFSVCTLLLIAAGVLRVLAAQTRASRVLADWLDGAHCLDAGSGCPTVQAKQGPPLLLYGVSTPKILASESAVAMLSSEELRVAFQHELGHLHARDNLKKLLFSATAFPGMGSLDHAWQDAAEFAADEAAVSSTGEAVELASALLKLAELAPAPELPAFTTGLVDCTELIKQRVQRLLEWKESNAKKISSEFYRLGWYIVPSALLTVFVATHYGQALSLTHRFTEWFIH